MSDEELRALERRWRESGSTEDEAAWLAERLRMGGLTIQTAIRTGLVEWASIDRPARSALRASLAIDHLAES